MTSGQDNACLQSMLQRAICSGLGHKKVLNIKCNVFHKNNANKCLILPKYYSILSEEYNVLYIGHHFDMIITKRSALKISDFFL